MTEDELDAVLKKIVEQGHVEKEWDAETGDWRYRMTESGKRKLDLDFLLNETAGNA